MILKTIERGKPSCCQVILVVGSMHHLMSGLAFLDVLRGRFGVLHLTILCDGFLEKKFHFNDRVMELIYKKFNGNVCVEDFSSVISDLSFLKSSPAGTLYYITPRWFSIKIYIYLKASFIRKGHFFWVESEEGIGSYRTLLERIGGALVQWSVSVAFKMFVNDMLGRLLIHRKIRFLDLGRSSLRLGRDLDSLRKNYKEFYSCRSGFQDGVPGRPVMLYASQPVVELGWLSDKQYHAFIWGVKRHAESCGYVFRVRPHPSEDWSKYDPPLIYRNGASIEDIVANDHSVVSVASICSTALYSSKIIRGVRSVIYVDEDLYARFYLRPSSGISALRKISDDFVII